MIMDDKRQEWKARKQEVVATEVETKEVDSVNIEKPPYPTHDYIK